MYKKNSKRNPQQYTTKMKKPKKLIPMENQHIQTEEVQKKYDGKTTGIKEPKKLISTKNHL